MDARLTARYPFLPEASELVRSEGPLLDDLLGKLVWKPARARGRERVLASLDGAPVPASHAASDHEALVAVLAYVLARVLVSSVNDKQLTNRYATAEARRAGDDLEAEEDEMLVRVARSLGVAAEPRASEFAVPFTDYLRATQDLSSLDWKLVNQRLDRGWVLLGKKRLARTVQEALKLRLLAELPLTVPPDVAKALAPWPEEIRTRLAEMRSKSVELSAGEITPEAFPPCIKALISSIQASENVSHEGRFAVVAFLHTIGMERDKIVEDLFSSVPDFAKEITSYQVDHITGRKAHEAYTPPGCGAMQTYGLCPMMTRAKGEWDRWCEHEKMKHPLTYYRWGLFRLGKLHEGAPATADTKPAA